MKKELGISVLLLALCTVTAIMNPRFISPVNLVNLANSIGLFGIFSLGLGLVIITGGIDLSVGSVFALAGVLLAMALTEWSWSWRSWDFSTAQITHEQIFVEKLQSASDPVSKYLWNQFPEEFRQEISKANGGANTISRQRLAQELNQILRLDSIYEKRRFAEIG